MERALISGIKGKSLSFGYLENEPLLVLYCTAQNLDDELDSPPPVSWTSSAAGFLGKVRPQEISPVRPPDALKN